MAKIMVIGAARRSKSVLIEALQLMGHKIVKVEPDAKIAGTNSDIMVIDDLYDADPPDMAIPEAFLPPNGSQMGRRAGQRKHHRRFE